MHTIQHSQSRHNIFSHTDHDRKYLTSNNLKKQNSNLSTLSPIPPNKLLSPTPSSNALNKLNSPSPSQPNPSTPSSPENNSPATISKLPDIDLNVRKKLAANDLSVKFVNKSPALTLGKTLIKDNYDTFGLEEVGGVGFIDSDDEEENSSIGSHKSNQSPRLNSFKHSFSMKLKNIPSIYKERANPIKEEEDQESQNNYEHQELVDHMDVPDLESLMSGEVEDDVSISRMDPKQYESPLDAHRSFVKYSKAQNRIHNMKHLTDRKSLPTKKSLKYSRKAREGLENAGSPSKKEKNSDDMSIASKSFLFLTNLTQKIKGTISGKVDDNQSEKDETNSLYSQEIKNLRSKVKAAESFKAPLDQNISQILQKSLSVKTFSRFNDGDAAESPNVLLRALDTVKTQGSPKHELRDAIPEGKDEDDSRSTISNKPEADKPAESSLYPTLRPLRTLNNDERAFAKVLDHTVALLTYVPPSPRPVAPPPIKPKPLTLETVFDNNELMKADLKKQIPDHVYESIMNTSFISDDKPKVLPNNLIVTPRKRQDLATTVYPEYLTALENSNDLALFIPDEISFPPLHEDISVDEPKPSSKFSLPKLNLRPLPSSKSHDTVNSQLTSNSSQVSKLPPVNSNSSHSSNQQVVEHQPSSKTRSNSILLNYAHALNDGTQKFLSLFIKKPESKTDPPKDITEGVNAERPQPMADEDQAYVYQYSTNSYVPKNYLNVTQYGIPQRGQPHQEDPNNPQFSIRHLHQIEDSTTGVCEPVIYLPPEFHVQPKVTSANESNNRMVKSIFDEEDEDHELVEQLQREPEGRDSPGQRVETLSTISPLTEAVVDGKRFIKVQSFDLRSKELLSPGVVLSKPNFMDARKIVDKVDPNHPHFANYQNLYDLDDDDIEDEKKGQSLTKLHTPKRIQDNKNNPSTNEVKKKLDFHPSTSMEPNHPELHSQWKYQSSPSLSKYSQNTGSKVDLRDEILDYLKKSKSPIASEYEQYYDKTKSSPQTDEYPKPKRVDSMESLNSLTSTQSTFQQHQKLWERLNKRYANDPEGKFHMNNKIKSYLREGVKEETHVMNTYLEEIDGW